MFPSQVTIPAFKALVVVTSVVENKP